ncbi:DAL4 [Candida pseudojiufengensis]|uniref:DAL4 n=1 Tax=Candida pseudojiufengensis TaxID=497109 RepID=UPI0022248A93|nr:DAL4 [Candida pseudojiufengensis]KAI5967787.1 DAL4 [Candida pseudojiufengensis]
MSLEKNSLKIETIVNQESSVDNLSDQDDVKKESKWQRFIKFIEVQPMGDLTTSQLFLYNHDLKPVEKARRTWKWYNYVSFWIADSFNINTWQIAATYFAVGGGFGLMIWALVRSHGLGDVLNRPNGVQGSALAWAFVQSTLNALSNFATLISNSPDFSRFAYSQNSFAMKYLVHTISIPVCFGITSLIGILVTAAAEHEYGTTYWSPIDVMAKYLESFTPGIRAAIFFIALSFIVAQLGTNISANSLSFSTDVSAVAARFINIRRGSYICLALALPICPWKLLSSSSTFTTYLSAYSVFLSSIIGVMACDYYYVRRGFINLPDLYSLRSPTDKSKLSLYAYNKYGVNWRAVVAYICGILPNMVGFVGATGHKVPIGATYVYRINFFAGFFSSFIVYAVLYYLFPFDTGIPKLKPFEKGWFEETHDVENFEEEVFGHELVGIERYENDDEMSLYQRKEKV